MNHIEKLIHFRGVAEAGSIRSYAVRNNLSQPAISKCIQILETDLEVSLMVRNRNGIVLTSAGNELFQFADKIINSANQLDDKLRTHGKIELKANLTMGSYQSIAVYLIPIFFKFAKKQQAGLNLNLVTAKSSDLIQNLKSGKVDFIISVNPPNGSQLVHSTILEDKYSLYKRTGADRKIESDSIFTVLEATDSNSKTLESYLKDLKLLKNTISCGDFEVVKSMAEHDAGFGLMPNLVAKPLVRSGKIELVTSTKSLVNIGPHKIVFSCRKHRTSDAAIIWVQEQLSQIIRSEFY